MIPERKKKMRPEKKKDMPGRKIDDTGLLDDNRKKERRKRGK